MAEATESLWERTTAVDYMKQEGRADNPSHAWMTQRLVELYHGTDFSLLDCGVMSGVTYRRLREVGLPVEYTGIDIGRPIIEACREEFPEARWEEMSVADLSFATESFDVVNSRHLLESLPYYETAVREFFRVSRKYVVICFFQPPKDPEALLRRDTPNGYIWLNRYAPGPFRELLDKLSSGVEVVDLTDSGLRPNRIYFCTK